MDQVMVLTEHLVQVHYDVLTTLSRLHSKGALHVTEPAIARESGYLEHDVHIVLRDAEGFGWVLMNRSDPPSWRLRDLIVTPVLHIKECDGCRAFDNIETRAYANARTSDGRWANVCAKHFMELGCRIGPGLGQFLRLEY